MPERCYQFWTSDQPAFNWLTRVTSRQGGYATRTRYAGIVCPSCGGFSLDDAFRLGFDPSIRVSAKKGRKLIVTDDHFLCVADDLLRALETAEVKGFVSTPLPETAWHVVSVTERQPMDPSVYEPSGRKCGACGRQGLYGIADFERQIERPTHGLTFFCTSAERGQGGFDLFVTEPLLEVLRATGTKGITFRRLLNAEEASQVEEKRKKQPTWKPKGSSVVL